MIYLRHLPKLLLLLALLTVQYGALLHAIEHPFHAHDENRTACDIHFKDEQLTHAEHHHCEFTNDSHDPHTTDISCDTYFAAERLANATFQSDLSIASQQTIAISYDELLPATIERHKLRPRSRSPPTVSS